MLAREEAVPFVGHQCNVENNNTSLEVDEKSADITKNPIAPKALVDVMCQECDGRDDAKEAENNMVPASYQAASSHRQTCQDEPGF